MPATINGLPLHPLVVHAVVVLLPLAALGVIALAVRPSWRSRYGYLVIGAAAVATVAIPPAAESGESLESRVGDPGRHAQLGGTLIWFALALLAVAVGLVWLDRRAARILASEAYVPERAVAGIAGTGQGAGRRRGLAGSPAATGSRRPAGRRGGLVAAVAVLAIVVAAANLVQVYRVGDTGAKAVWGGTATTAGR